MTNWFFHSQDLLSLLMIPLVVTTFISVRKNWASLWDDDLTKEDRELLLRAVLFLLLPIAVLCHELGHAAATLAFGGRIVEFHYALLWGYVIPEGNFTKPELLCIYLAGNLVEVLMGLIALVWALCLRAPAKIATLVYFGLWTIGTTLVFYPALSLAGMYGDWIAIYTAPLPEWLAWILVFHIFFVTLLGYAVYGQMPRLWFTRATDKEWDRAYTLLLNRLKAPSSDPSDYLRLAKLCEIANLKKLARQFVNKFESLQ